MTTPRAPPAPDRGEEGARSSYTYQQQEALSAAVRHRPPALQEILAWCYRLAGLPPRPRAAVVEPHRAGA